MQENKNDKNNLSLTNYRTPKASINNSSSSEDSDIFTDAADGHKHSEMMSDENSKNKTSENVPKLKEKTVLNPATLLNSSGDTSDNSVTNAASVERNDTVEDDVIHPSLENTTDKDLEMLNTLTQLAIPSRSQIVAVKAADAKPDETLKIFRALNGNPADVGYGAKNFTDLPVNNVTLRKAIRVGNLEKTIKDISSQN